MPLMPEQAAACREWQGKGAHYNVHQAWQARRHFVICTCGPARVHYNGTTGTVGYTSNHPHAKSSRAHFRNRGVRAQQGGRAGGRAGGAMRAGGVRACGLSPPQGQPEPARRGTTRNGDPALSPPAPAPLPCSNGGVGHHEGAVGSGPRSAMPCVRFRCRTHRRPALEQELGGMQGRGAT
ncbi:hypothetical protein B0H14DRAFT_2584155 [Mycena olivaceomarginata]|nr:hypothetical protein B0H14DRAFT_2584155 [Mycena olivaceomarginata]